MKIACKTLCFECFTGENYAFIIFKCFRFSFLVQEEHCKFRILHNLENLVITQLLNSFFSSFDVILRLIS